MPIYAYKCESCGHAKDVLQRMSDDPLTNCPACGKASFQKQVTAAGFQLKGSGWYVTDFRGGNTASAPDKAEAGAEAQPAASAGADAKVDGATAAPVAAKSDAAGAATGGSASTASASTGAAATPAAPSKAPSAPAP